MAELENNVTENDVPEVEFFYEEETKSNAGKFALIGLVGVGIGYGISKVTGKIKTKLAECKARKSLEKVNTSEQDQVAVDETAQESEK